MPAEEAKGLPALCLLTYFLDWTDGYRREVSIDKIMGRITLHIEVIYKGRFST